MSHVEVIVAVHDPARPLARCVRSVLDQEEALAAAGGTLALSVVVHNTDVDAVRSRVPDDLAERVRWSHLVDGVRSAAGPFNQGLDEATGEYLSTVGSDDVLEPGALAAWFTRARETRADAVVAALRTSAGVVLTPYLRPGRRPTLDPVADGLAYRTAPLGLLRLDTVRRIGFRYTEGGHVNGEDVEPGLRMWFRGGRVAYPYGAPCYRVLDDMGESRASATVGPLGRELGFLPALLAQEWLREASTAEREAIAVKLAREQLLGAVRRRATLVGSAAGTWWTPADAASTARGLAGLAALSGNDLAALSVAERALLEEAGRAPDDGALVAAARSAAQGPAWRRVLPGSPRGMASRWCRPRVYATQRLTRRSGAFVHPDPPPGRAVGRSDEARARD